MSAPTPARTPKASDASGEASSMPTPKDLQPIFTLHRKAASAKLPHDAPLEALPPYWQRAIARLRKENAKARIDLRDTRQELAEAQQRIATLMLDIADLRQGIAP